MTTKNKNRSLVIKTQIIKTQVFISNAINPDLLRFRLVNKYFLTARANLK